MKDGFNHQDDCYHQHPDGSTHLYPYNGVNADHECDGGEGYMDFVDEDLDHSKNHSWGLSGDNLQVLHQASCWKPSDGTWVGGAANNPGVDSIATEQGFGGGTSAHEFGHNFHADHGKAKCFGKDRLTIMAAKGDPPCADSTDHHVWDFSQDNVDEVDAHSGA